MAEPAAFGPRSRPTGGDAPPMPPQLSRRPSEGASAQPTYCYACSAPLDPRAVICPACGVSQRREAASSAHPNAVVALILNLVFPGVGTLVLGQTNIGIIQLVLLIVSIPLDFVLIGIPLGFAMWVWALVVSIQGFSSGGRVHPAIR